MALMSEGVQASSSLAASASEDPPEGDGEEGGAVFVSESSAGFTVA